MSTYQGSLGCVCYNIFMIYIYNICIIFGPCGGTLGTGWPMITFLRLNQLGELASLHLSFAESPKNEASPLG